MARRGRLVRKVGRTAFRLRAAVAGLLLCAFFVGFLGAGPASDRLSAALGSIQLFPGAVRLAAGVFGGSAAAIAILAALSAVFGRFYCSTLCPLGTAQDASAFLGRLSAGKAHFRYRAGLPMSLRMLFPALAIVAIAAGASPLAGMLDPYSLLGRFLQHALRPAMLLGANFLAPLMKRAGLYWASDLESFSPWAAGAAAGIAIAVLAAAFIRGRLFCNSLCPVGACLGALNAAAPFRVRLNAESCVACGACGRVCAAECVDGAARRLDADRCVSCLACLPVCPTGALHYGRRRQAASSGLQGHYLSRGEFVQGLGVGIAAAVATAEAPSAAAVATEGAKPPFPDALSLEPASPPGSGTRLRFLSTCTACGLCVSKCPSGVLKPSILRYGPRGFLAPYLDYDASYCQYECVLCAELCPTGALRKLTLTEKSLTQMGTAALVREKCIVFTKKTACGACAEHCPTGSVRMAPSPTGIPEPIFDEAVCVGCGACHHVCPALPDKAITVAGKRMQGTALPPTKDLFATGAAGPPPDKSADEFPF